MARKIGFSITEATISKIKILAGQGSIKEDEIVDAAINLLYKVIPDNRDARIIIGEEVTLALEHIEKSKNSEETE